MREPTSDVCLLTPVPLQHLVSGMARCAETGLVVYGTNSGMVLSEFRAMVDEDHPADILFYASEDTAPGPPVAKFRGRFEGYREGRAGRADKEWAPHRPPTTETDGAWLSFYAVSNLRELETPIALATLSKRDAKGKLAKNFYPLGPVIIDTPF